MTDEEFQLRLNLQTSVTQEFIDNAFKYWFTDDEQGRSPFPDNIQEELGVRTFRKFMEWVFEEEEHNRFPYFEQLIPVFVEIIYEEAFALAETNDEKLTIVYPQLPRVGEWVYVREKETDPKKVGQIMSREIITKEGKEYCRFMLKSEDGREEWGEVVELESGE
jgi:hypothetical protein